MWLGVGYGTLIYHLWKALNMFDSRRAKVMLRHQPKDIRATLLGRECRENLIIADGHWDSRAIDIQETDLILLPPDVCLEGKCVTLLERDAKRTTARAVTPGIGRVAATRSEWSAYIRVSRQQFVGRAQYRFEEEVDDAE